MALWSPLRVCGQHGVHGFAVTIANPRLHACSQMLGGLAGAGAVGERGVGLHVGPTVGPTNRATQAPSWHGKMATTAITSAHCHCFERVNGRGGWVNGVPGPPRMHASQPHPHACMQPPHGPTSPTLHTCPSAPSLLLSPPSQPPLCPSACNVQKGKSSFDPGSNWGPPDDNTQALRPVRLQSGALPTELSKGRSPLCKKAVRRSEAGRLYPGLSLTRRQGTAHRLA